jgi:protein TonB
MLEKGATLSPSFSCSLENAPLHPLFGYRREMRSMPSIKVNSVIIDSIERWADVASHLSMVTRPFDRFFSCRDSDATDGLNCAKGIAAGKPPTPFAGRSSLKTLIIAAAIATNCVAVPISWAADATIYTTVDKNPVPVKTPPPLYPQALKTAGTNGVVAISIVIDENGSVTESTVVKSTHVEFEPPALAAVKNWKFSPAQRNGNAVKMRLTIPIRFSSEE